MVQNESYLFADYSIFSSDFHKVLYFFLPNHGLTFELYNLFDEIYLLLTKFETILHLWTDYTVYHAFEKFARILDIRFLMLVQC